MTKNMNSNKIVVSIETVRNGVSNNIDFEYEKRSEDERPMALDVLVQAQNTSIPDLAFRYGCRARNCGVCTIDINDRPRVACRARVKNGDKLSALATLPILSDFVVRRDGIPRQLRGLKTAAKGNDLNVEAPEDYHALTACIECYACLDKCPMHAKNFEKGSPNIRSENFPNPEDGYKYGNPFSLLKLERICLDPLTSDQGKEIAIKKAIDIGLETCIDCPGCKCGVGIDLKGKVIKPILERAKNKI